MAYARYTKVPIDRSRAEIERLLTRYKADQFGTAIDNDKGRAMVQFRLQKRLIRFDLPFPKQSEQEFLSHFVMPDGRTYGEIAVPEMQKAITEGRMPQTLLEFKGEAA